MILLLQYGSVCCHSTNHLALGYIWTSAESIHERGHQGNQDEKCGGVLYSHGIVVNELSHGRS